MEKASQQHKGELSLWNESMDDINAILTKELDRIKGKKGVGAYLDKDSKSRALKKAQKDGRLTKSLYSQACDHLKNISYDLSQITSLQQFNQLTPSQIFGLQKIVEYQKLKTKKQTTMVEEEEKKENGNKQLQIQISSKFIEQLQEDPTKEAQLAVLTQQNKYQPVEFFKFLLESTNSNNQFLECLSNVINDEPMAAQKLRIFLGVCGLYKGKPLQIDLSLYQPMLEYIATEAEINSKQANGFMRLSFQNCIGLASSSLLKILLKFDKRFSGFFDQFYQYFDQFYIGHELTSLGAQIIISHLPKTSLILSIPMIKALKDPFSFNGIDSSHLETFLGIMTYQVPEDQQLFDELLLQFKQTTKQSFERIKNTQFSYFLEQLLKVMFSFNIKWFNNQVATCGLLMGVLAMIDQNKVPRSFSYDLCQSLLDGSSSPTEYLERPAQLSQEGTEEEMELLIKQMEDCNIKGTFRRMSSTLISEPELHLTPFTVMGIDLTIIQQLFLKLCGTYQQCFLCTGAGVGKTTFLCGLAISTCINTKEHVFFINSNRDLSYRDCTRALHWVAYIKAQKISVGEYIEGERLKSITFLSPEQFLKIQLPKQFHVVFDEVQYMIRDSSIPLIPLLKCAASFVGVTGSPMTTTHIQILQMLLPDSIVAQFPDPYKFNCIERPATVLRLISEWYKEIEAIMQQQQANAPVLFIMSTELIESCKKKFFNSKNIIFLDQCSQPELKLILEQQFACPLANNLYRCFITTQAGGIGIDYPSNPQIEANGGVRVCICVEPETYSDLHQFKRRTGRMSNKGIIHYVFLNKKYAGVINYVQFLEKLLQEEEELTLIKLKGILRTFFPTDIECQNEENSNIDEFKFQPEMNEKNIKEVIKGQIKEVEVVIMDGSEEDVENENNNEELKMEIIENKIMPPKEGAQMGICKNGCGQPIHIGKCQTQSVQIVMNSLNAILLDNTGPGRSQVEKTSKVGDSKKQLKPKNQRKDMINGDDDYDQSTSKQSKQGGKNNKTKLQQRSGIDSEECELNSSKEVQQQGVEQINNQKDTEADIPMKKETKMSRNEELLPNTEEINTSTKQQRKNIMDELPLDSDEEFAQFCNKCEEWQQNCLCQKDIERELQQRQEIMDKFKLKIADNSIEAQERRKAKEQYEAEVNSLMQVIKQKLQAESQEDFNSKLCKIYSIPTISHLPQRLCRMYGSKDTNLQACQDFLKQYDQSIVNKKETNQIQQYPVIGKKTNKRVAAPLIDDNSATPRAISKTMEASNIYQELKEQGKKKKFITGPANTLGFKYKVAQNKRTQKNIEKNQNIEKRQSR